MNPRYEYRALLACDIAGSAGRGEHRLQEIRRVLRAALSGGLAVADLGPRDFGYVDTGDGCQLIAPAGLPKAALLVPLLPELSVRIREHNEQACPDARLRVRVSAHAGELRFEPAGAVSGTPFEALARLLDSDPLRQASLAGPEGTPVAAILSRHVYEETVGHGYPGLERGAFTAAEVRVKEYAAEAWLWYPGSPVGPQPAAGRGTDSGTGTSPDERPERPEGGEPRRVEQLVQARGRSAVFAVSRGEQHVHYTERS
ncbi:hypothetical protein P3T35_001162 [Kitasatospora sp. GP30]|uniref:hypothetical protein n=1 Tax=Kitasatospora sp. GP30 TaxID=3035084 RepID=UPI000C711959|nr:hypothetical protein [Kitasatospora sp. GP30]MDH6139162.1 hypothetical protein [Kitasatospora sp. GP30]